MPGGYTWRTDARLTLPSPLRLTQAHVLNFVRSVECPVSLVLAEQGMLAVEPRMRALLETLPFERHHLPGGHHLHLDDEAGAQAVARVFAASSRAETPACRCFLDYSGSSRRLDGSLRRVTA